MRIVTEENQEFAEWDQNQQDSYVFNKYPGCFPGGYSYDVETFILTVQLIFVQEAGRTDLIPIDEPIIAFNIISGTFTEAYVQTNYPASYGKMVYPDATGHSLRLVGEDAGLLTVYFD